MKRTTNRKKKSSKNNKKNNKKSNDYWKGWGDFLGTGNLSPNQKSKLTQKQVDDVLDELDRNWVFYKRWTESLIRTWFEERGVYRAKDPYIKSFFTNFVDLRKTVLGRKALIKWLKTRNFRKSFYGLSLGGTATLQQIISPQYESNNKKKRKRLVTDDEDIEAKDLLKELRGVKIKFTDESDPKVVFTKQLLFRTCYTPTKEKSELKKIKKEGYNGNKFHDTVIKSFLKEYSEVNKIKLPETWIAKEKPNLMQKHIAYKLTKTNGFFNLSNQGSGKTLSAILASELIDSKYTLVICPNNIVNQWCEVIEKTINGAVVSQGKIPHERIRTTRNYHVINYDKFSFSFAKKVIDNLNRQKYDFIIIDETQNIKIREENLISNRRIMVMKFLRKINRKNPKLKRLCLTATPLINNIKEGKSLLQIITNEKFEDLGQLTTVREASKLHAHFLKFSIRYNKIYKNIKVIGRENYIKVKCEIPKELLVQRDSVLEKLTFLQIEQLLVRGKMKQIKKRVNGKTIIYTDWVRGISTYMAKELRASGIKTAIFTGRETKDEREKAIKGFVEGDTKVLIASSTIAEGFDKLQTVCSNMIFACLPFTYARYEHVIHRIIRSKQTRKLVRIHILNGELGAHVRKKWYGFPYDERIKLNRLEFKKGMAECVTEGRLPEKIRLPRSKVKKEIMKTIVKFKHSMIMTRHQARKLQRKGKLKWKI